MYLYVYVSICIFGLNMELQGLKTQILAGEPQTQYKGPSPQISWHKVPKPAWVQYLGPDTCKVGYLDLLGMTDISVWSVCLDVSVDL